VKADALRPPGGGGFWSRRQSVARIGASICLRSARRRSKARRGQGLPVLPWSPVARLSPSRSGSARPRTANDCLSSVCATRRPSDDRASAPLRNRRCVSRRRRRVGGAARPPPGAGAWGGDRGGHGGKSALGGGGRRRDGGGGGRKPLSDRGSSDHWVQRDPAAVAENPAPHAFHRQGGSGQAPARARRHRQSGLHPRDRAAGARPPTPTPNTPKSLTPPLGLAAPGRARASPPHP